MKYKKMQEITREIQESKDDLTVLGEQWRRPCKGRSWNVRNVRRVALDGELRCQVIVGDEIANRVKQVAGSSLGVENLY